MTTYEVDEYIYGALRVGASGFLLKDLEPDGSWRPAKRCSPRA